MRILPIPLDLGCAGKPIAECHCRFGRMAKVPAVDKAINSAGCKNVRIVSREVDVCDST